MEFRLIYQGPLTAKGSPIEKQEIRRIFHPQLAELWKQSPLLEVAPSYLDAASGTSLVFKLGDFHFVPLITQRLNLVCHLV